jgi:hypothetical protein
MPKINPQWTCFSTTEEGLLVAALKAAVINSRNAGHERTAEDYENLIERTKQATALGWL